MVTKLRLSWKAGLVLKRKRRKCSITKAVALNISETSRKRIRNALKARGAERNHNWWVLQQDRVKQRPKWSVTRSSWLLATIYQCNCSLYWKVSTPKETYKWRWWWLSPYRWRSITNNSLSEKYKRTWIYDRLNFELRTRINIWCNERRRWTKLIGVTRGRSRRRWWRKTIERTWRITPEACICEGSC